MPNIQLDLALNRLGDFTEEITAFCTRWRIIELALFGSVLRSDFCPETSDIDVLVTFAPDYRWKFDDAMQMQEELETLFGRKVDILSKQSIEQSINWIRKQEILNSAQVIYASK
ncbi:nucleotidyltransferase family protein [Microseira wollei]|uniref:DNA polymerase beta domain-containing protein n=1 Tax=Microseira wollei NIES-4236 TaxID=2530354 RepID=A0AAV3XCL6_9CYAN|nr:nucleotidyltransferase domain-containing protein [Microseira wollei]GET37825.1 DNA polymerase beta domain-containing protein [Microseira wollei NIES-4236]